MEMKEKKCSFALLMLSVGDIDRANRKHCKESDMKMKCLGENEQKKIECSNECVITWVNSEHPTSACIIFAFICKNIIDSVKIINGCLVCVC